MKAVLTLSLFGANDGTWRRYASRLLASLERWKTFAGSAEWTVRLYHDDRATPKFLTELKKLVPTVELVNKRCSVKLEGTMWRFEVHNDPTVDLYLSMDVEEGFEPDIFAHFEAWRRDPDRAYLYAAKPTWTNPLRPGQPVPIPAGCFAVDRRKCPSFTVDWKGYGAEYGSDELYLTDVFLPAMNNTITYGFEFPIDPAKHKDANAKWIARIID